MGSFAGGRGVAGQHTLFGIGDQIEQRGGKQRVVPAERLGGNGQRLRVGDGVHALGGLAGCNLLGIGLADLHHCSGIGVCRELIQLEHGRLVFLIGAVQDAEGPVYRKDKEVAHLGDEGTAAAAVQQVENDIKAIGDKLFIEGTLHPVLEGIFLPGGVAFRQLLNGKGETVAVRGAAQNIISGNAVEIGGAHQKIKTAFPDAVFVMGKQSLGDPKLLCGTLLADAFFFSQQGE